MNKKLIIMVLTFMLAVVGFSGTEAQAASKKTKALRAYADYIVENDYKQFALADINGDGVKELFLKFGYEDELYVYKSGKVVRIDDFNYAWGVTYYPNKNYIFTQRVGIFDDTTVYYRLTKKGKIKALAGKYGSVSIEDGDIVNGRKVKYTYRVNGKKVTKKKYNAYVKKLKKNSKKLKLKYRENTYKNRKKYLKSRI